MSNITESSVPDSQSNTSTLSNEEVQTLKHLMDKLDPPSSSNFAHAAFYYLMQPYYLIVSPTFN
jgi:ATP-dependent helicase/DNAse subunit B